MSRTNGGRPIRRHPRARGRLSSVAPLDEPLTIPALNGPAAGTALPLNRSGRWLVPVHRSATLVESYTDATVVDELHLHTEYVGQEWTIDIGPQWAHAGRYHLLGYVVDGTQLAVLDRIAAELAVVAVLSSAAWLPFIRRAAT